MAPMALNNNVTNREPQYSASNVSDKYITVENMCNAMINDLYKINQQKYAKYRKTTKKYFAATETTNPYLNDPNNTVYHKENEDEHSKNSGKLYQNNTHKVKKN
jgi:hypothetical protein